MKHKTKRIYQSVTALVLAVVMLFTYCDISSFAGYPSDTNKKPAPKDGASSTAQSVPAGGADGSPATDGYQKYEGTYAPNLTAAYIPGYVITLMTIQNEIDTPENNEGIAAYNATKEISKQVNQCQFQTIKKYIYKYPEIFYDNATDLANKSVLLIYRKGNNVSYRDTNFEPVCYKDDNKISHQFKTWDSIEKNQTLTSGSPENWHPYEILISYLNNAANAKWVELFREGKILSLVV